MLSIGHLVIWLSIFCAVYTLPGDGPLHKKKTTLRKRQADDLDVKFQLDKALVPAKTEAISWCRVFKLPTTDVPYQMIKYDALIAPGEEKFVDRILMWRCNSDMEQYVDTQVQCIEEQVFSEMRRSCARTDDMIARHSTGEEGATIFKDGTGYSLLEPGNKLYVMLRVVYQNPSDTDLLGNSGLQLTLTPNLRPIESGTLRILTLYSTPYYVIPPRMKGFVQSAACIPECTKDFNADGINIYQAMPYTHNAVSGYKLRHFRGKSELKPIVSVDNHDPKHQKAVTLDEERKVLPGDALVLECTYNTEDREEPSLGGYVLPKKEFCSLYLSYYPKAQGDVHTCFASPEPQFYATALDVHDLVITDTGVTVKRNSDNKEISYEDAVTEYNWTSANTQKFIDIISHAKYYAGCVNRSFKDGTVLVNKVVLHDQLLPST